MDSEIIENTIHLLIDKEIYNEDVLHKCFYWYTSNFNVTVGVLSEKQFSVLLKPKDEKQNLSLIVEKIKCDLIDYKLRDIVAKETKTIRELLVAKAFCYYGLDENPFTEISDPVGFNPDGVNQNKTWNEE